MECFGVDLFIDVAADGFQMAFGANAAFYRRLLENNRSPEAGAGPQG
jgi:hypothetical protein